MVVNHFSERPDLFRVFAVDVNSRNVGKIGGSVLFRLSAADDNIFSLLRGVSIVD